LQIRNEFLKRKLWAFEIKLTTSPGKRDLDRLKKTAAMIGADRSVLVSKSNRTIQGQDAVITAIKGFLKLIAALQ
jgi:hypothetical protein